MTCITFYLCVFEAKSVPFKNFSFFSPKKSFPNCLKEHFHTLYINLIASVIHRWKAYMSQFSVPKIISSHLFTLWLIPWFYKHGEKFLWSEFIHDSWFQYRSHKYLKKNRFQRPYYISFLKMYGLYVGSVVSEIYYFM